MKGSNMKHNWVKTDETPGVSPYKCSACGEPLVASSEDGECNLAEKNEGGNMRLHITLREQYPLDSSGVGDYLGAAGKYGSAEVEAPTYDEAIKIAESEISEVMGPFDYYVIFITRLKDTDNVQTADK